MTLDGNMETVTWGQLEGTLEDNVLKNERITSASLFYLNVVLKCITVWKVNENNNV